MRKIYKSTRPSTKNNPKYEIVPEDPKFLSIWAATENHWLTHGDFADGTKNITYQLVSSLTHKLGGIELSEQWVGRAIQQLQSEGRDKRRIKPYLNAIRRVYAANGAGDIAIPTYKKIEHVDHYHYKRPATVEKLIRFGNNETQQAIIAFYYYQAVRNSELIDLKMKDLHMEPDRLEVNIYGKKTREWRMIPLDPRLLPYLNVYLELRRDKFVPSLEAQGLPVPPNVFLSETGTPFSTEGTRVMVHRTAKRAGFEGLDLEEAHPHVLRHSRANHMLHLEDWPITDVAYFLGDRVATCERYYSHTGVHDCRKNMMRTMRR